MMLELNDFLDILGSIVSFGAIFVVLSSFDSSSDGFVDAAVLSSFELHLFFSIPIESSGRREGRGDTFSGVARRVVFGTADRAWIRFNRRIVLA